MKIHDRCPTCDESGVEVEAQDDTALVCTNDACRVVVFTRYYG